MMCPLLISIVSLCLFTTSYGTKQVTITDAGATKLFQSMWNGDVDAFELGVDYKINPQTKIRKWDSTADEASHKFFQSVDERKLNSNNIYLAFMKLLDNYDRETGKAEVETAAEKAEIKTFLDLVINTSVMKEAHKFLVSKGLAKHSQHEFHKQLETLWFQTYRRTKGNRNRDSSGFEHVFVGETRMGEVMGLHNWVQFYREEKAGRVNYNGYKKKSCDYLYAVSFNWHRDLKPMNSLLLGTSPEFEMAIYTVSHLLLNQKQATAISTNMGPCRVKIICHPYSGGRNIGTCYPQ